MARLVSLTLQVQSTLWLMSLVGMTTVVHSARVEASSMPFLQIEYSTHVAQLAQSMNRSVQVRRVR
jgi:hypothetical protein